MVAIGYNFAFDWIKDRASRYISSYVNRIFDTGLDLKE